MPNDHLSSLPRHQKSNAKHEKNILSSSMASRALLLKQLSVMHQAYNTNTSRSYCQLFTQNSLPWAPCKNTSTSKLSSYLSQDSRRKQGENSEPVRPVLFIGHKRPQINDTVVQVAGKISECPALQTCSMSQLKYLLFYFFFPPRV